MSERLREFCEKYGWHDLASRDDTTCMHCGEALSKRRMAQQRRKFKIQDEKEMLRYFKKLMEVDPAVRLEWEQFVADERQWDLEPWPYMPPNWMRANPNHKCYGYQLMFREVFR